MATAKTKKTSPKKRTTAKAPSNGQAGSFAPYTVADYTHTDLGLKDEQVLAMYRDMLLQRRFEERSAQMYGQQKIAGFLHLYIGQEAVSTGTAFAMEDQDYAITAYRDHGLALSMGMTADECMAELFGKIDGCSRGKGGSMHFFSAEKHFLGGHGIVGGQIPLGVGVAFGCKYKKTNGICVTFFGDGAIQQGAFHEAANLAGLYNLPVILACENNMYGMGTAVDRSSAITDLYKRAESYDLHGVLVDGMNVFRVYKAMQDYAALARKGEGCLMEIRTYRYRGHSASDPAKYRTKEELASKKDEDPIIQLKSYVISAKLADNEQLDQVDEDVKAEVMASVKFAEQSPFPEEATMYEDVYVQEDYPFIR